MKSKNNTFRVLAAAIPLFLLACGSSMFAAEKSRFDARSGSKMRLEGTSVIHDWQAECTLILGFLEVGSNFPIEPGQSASPGKVEAQGEAVVMVRSLRSVTKEGKPHSDVMDDKMYTMMKQAEHPKIVFHLKDLVLKEAPKDKSAPYVFESQGDLTIAGVTNKISMTVNILPLGAAKDDKRLKISGSVPLVMTDFGIQPATMILPQFKTDPKVTVKFDWIVGQKKPTTAAK